MLVGNGYQCVGGPLDGEMRQLAPGHTEWRVAVYNGPNPLVPLSGPASPIPPRFGVYRVERHTVHGYVLRWHAPAE